MKTRPQVGRCLAAAAAGLLLTTATSACGGGTAGAGTKDVSLRLDFVHTGKDAIWTYGIQQGYFKDAGINLTLQDGKGSATTGQTVGNGADSFGLVDGGTLITLAAKGVPLKAVAGVFAQSPLVILSPASAPITNPAQLAGKKVAITSGDGPSTLLSALLDKNHVDKTTIDRVNLQPQAKLTSLLSHQVDAVATTKLVKATLQAKGLETTAMAYSDFGVATPGWYLATSTGYLNADKALVQKFVQATQKSIDAAVAHPDAAVASFVKAYPDYPQARAEAELALVLPLVSSPQTKGHPTGWMSPDLATSSASLLQQYGGIAPKPVQDYLTDEFVK